MILDNPLPINPMSASTAEFFNNPRLANGHPLVDRLAHVVDSQRGSHRGRQRFHLDSRATETCDRGGDKHGTVYKIVFGMIRQSRRLQVEVNLDTSDSDAWVTERDNVGGLFGGHDPSDAGNAKNVPLLHELATAEEPIRCGVREGNDAGSGGQTFRDRLLDDLGHVDCLRRRQVRQVGIRRSGQRGNRLAFLYISGVRLGALWIMLGSFGAIRSTSVASPCTRCEKLHGDSRT
jgi:hypothetical protein